MDYGAAGAGAGGGLFASIVAWLGVNKRLDRQDRDIEKLEEGTMWRTTCAATHKGVDDSLLRIEKKLDQLIREGSHDSQK